MVSLKQAKSGHAAKTTPSRRGAKGVKTKSKTVSLKQAKSGHAAKTTPSRRGKAGIEVKPPKTKDTADQRKPAITKPKVAEKNEKPVKTQKRDNARRKRNTLTVATNKLKPGWNTKNVDFGAEDDSSLSYSERMAERRRKRRSGFGALDY